MSQVETGPGFLLKALDRLTKGWVNNWSIAAIPLLRRKTNGHISTQQFGRDLYVSLWLLSSVLSLFIFPFIIKKSVFLPLLITAIGLYRAIDVYLTFSRVGVFLCFRGDVSLSKEPIWRVRRLLLGVFINYIELILWFSIFYYFSSFHSPIQFGKDSGFAMYQALNLSFSTMTTVGYGGYAPESAWTTMIAMFQTLIGILIAVIVTGSLISLLNNDARTPVVSISASPKTGWLKPLVGTTTLIGMFCCWLYFAFVQ